jgi:hypothetical protein
VAGAAPLEDNRGVQIAQRLAACGLAVSALVLTAGALAFDRIAAGRHIPGAGPAWLYPFLVAAISAPAFVGAVIATRRPRNPIGWVLVLGALSIAAVVAGQTYGLVALDANHAGSLPGGTWAALVASQWPFFFAWPLAIAFVFPDGRLPSRRWRPYSLFAVVSMSLLVVLLVLSAHLEKPFSDVTNPFPLRFPDALGFLRLPIWLAVFSSLFVGAAAARSRYARSTGIERLQMLWLAYATLLIPLGVVCFLVLGLVFGQDGDAPLAFLLAMEAAVALAVGIAVTRYRLYEIDRLINRTLVYALVTAALGVVYALVSVLGGVAAGRGSPWVAALAALAVAAAFRPLRRRAQAAVDWRFVTDGSCCVLLRAASGSFALKSDEEQAALVEAFGRFLNSISEPVAIYIRSEPLDLTDRATKLDEQAASLRGRALADAARAHAEFLRQLPAGGELRRRELLLLICTRAREIAAARTTLERRAAETTELLRAAGVELTPLDGEQTAALLARALDPDGMPAGSTLAGVVRGC